MTAIRDRALLLHRHPFGESSLVVQAFTRSRGRQHFLAKGAYRPRSAFAFALDLFDTLELTWEPKRTSELQLLRGAAILERRRALSERTATYRAALAVLELLDLGAPRDQPEPELFDLATASLDRLAAGDGPPELELAAFDLRFLKALGLAPALERCAACAGPAPPVVPGRAGAEGGPPRAAFSAGAGGRLCARCAADARASGRRVGTLPVELLRLARALLEAPPERLAGLPLEPPQFRDVRDFVGRFLAYHLETLPRSRRPRAGRPPARPPARSRADGARRVPTLPTTPEP